LEEAPVSRDRLVLTCEHGGNRIPREYARLFRGARSTLESHRGWDPGALQLARLVARRLRVRLHAVTWSRLFVEANRSPTNRRIWSRFTADLPKEERARILERWWQPHRRAVEAAVEKGQRHGRVVHVAMHSFTSELDGEVRNADIAFLYDSRREREAEFCRRWAAILRSIDSSLRLRFNYPYLGKADGLATALRARHPQSRYLGVELEVNQALVGGRRWRSVQEAIAASLGQLIG
jgi:predicted N-formylglutamate amidohydrolase